VLKKYFLVARADRTSRRWLDANRAWIIGRGCPAQRQVVPYLPGPAANHLTNQSDLEHPAMMQNTCGLYQDDPRNAR